MSNPIFAMLLGVGVGLAVTLYMYYQDQRSPVHSYDSQNQNWPGPSNTGSRPRNSRSKTNQDLKSNEPCTICLDDKSEDSWQILDCKHRFHAKCITKWFNEKRSCPTCRAEIGSPYWY